MNHPDTAGYMQEKVGAGMNSDVYVIGNDRVLKVFKPSRFKKADIEYKKTLIAIRIGIPAPKLYGLSVTENGNPAIEMEYIPGENLYKYLFDHPHRYPFIFYKMARLSARTVSIPCDYPDSEADFAGEYMDIKRSVISQFHHISRFQCVLPEEAARMRRFYESIPESRCFVHGDFDTTNIIVSGKGENLRLIDFGDSGFGSWLFDFLRMYDIYYNPKSGRPGRLRTFVKRLFFRYYLWVYLRVSNKKDLSTAVVLHTVGAMVDIGRLVDLAWYCPETGDEDVRRYADRALKCIDFLPDGIFPAEE